MALQYLLDPAFQVVNTAGKPATGGYINVFIHGTRDRYYCASDFNGTLHPFNIPLDSLGSNVVLADDSRAYDVYVYNRYGTQLYSRYNVRASAGGGISSTEIISSDGSITVTDTANGVDLSVNGVKPSVLRAGTIPRTSDGSFTFTYKEREGDDITLDQGGIKLAKGWYHYDVSVEIEWNAPAENRSVPVVITAANGAARDELDLTFSHTDSLTLCGELHNPSVNLMDFEVAASGIPTGATVRVKEVGIHTVHGAGGGGTGEKNVHRLLRWYTNAGTAEYPAGDWLHDLDAEDPDDPSGHPRVTADQLFEWFGEGQNFELYEVDGRNGQLGWSAVYRMVTWQDQSDWWSQYAPEPGKACRLEFFRMGMYSTPYRGGLIAYIRYKDEEYMRLYEIMPGQSIWMAEYQEKLPYYRYDWHNGDYLRVNEAGTGLEWASLPPQVNADWNAVSGPGEVLNKPEIPTKTSDLDNDSGFITLAEVPAQVNSDWNAVSGPEMILNKPAIPTKTSDLQNDSGFVTSAEIPEQVNADWESTSGKSEILNKPQTVPLVAGSNIAITETQNGIEISAAGSPEQVNADWDAVSGPAEILHKPSIPTKTSDLQNDSEFITASQVPEQVNADWNATSGAAEILNKPTIPSGAQLVPAATASDEDKVLTVNSQGIPEWAEKGGAELFYVTYNVTTYDEIKAAHDAGKWPVLVDSSGRVAPMTDYNWIGTSSSIQYVQFQAREYDFHSDNAGADYYEVVYYLELEFSPDMQRTETWSTTSHYSSADWNAVSGPRAIRNKPTLAAVATSGSYSDLSNTPTIPTATSDLTNDSGFITLAEVPAQVNSDWDAVSGPEEILNKPQTAPLVAGTNITITETQNGIEIAAQGGGSSVNADWDAVSGPEEILNKPTPKTLTAGSNITITETASTITIGANVPAAQVNADWDAVSGAAEILNKPAVDQSYDGTSTNAQSGTAVAEAIGNLPTSLSAAQLLALKQALGVDETVLWEDANGASLHTGITLSESRLNFESIRLLITCQTGASTMPMGYVDIPMVGVNTSSSFVFQMITPFSNDTGATFALTWKVLMSATNTTLQSTNALYWGKTNFDGSSSGAGSWTQGSNTDVPIVYKVVGVHRIASN